MLMFNIVEPDTLDAQGADDITYADNVQRPKNPPKPKTNANASKPLQTPKPSNSRAWSELMKFFGWTGNDETIDSSAKQDAHTVLSDLNIKISSPSDLTEADATAIRDWMKDHPDMAYPLGPELFEGDDINEVETRK